MSSAEYIAIAGVVATCLSALVTWALMKRQMAAKKLTYQLEIESILKNTDADLAGDLKIFYRGEELPTPALLSLTVLNSGYYAIEDLEILVRLPGATYLIPGYFVDLAPGYEDLWSIERTDAEECRVRLKHLNPGKTAKIRLIMDEMPDGEPMISCPMPNVECTRARQATLGMVSEVIVSIVAPQLLDARLRRLLT